MGAAEISYIGLGSNQDQPRQKIEQALQCLDQLPNSRLLRCSSFYQSAAIGLEAQPDFINAVAELETQLSPFELLNALQSIEQAQGRQRQQHWGQRCLDLDLLLYGQQVLQSPDLILPHPQIIYRAFVLYPLFELEPQLFLPKWGKIKPLMCFCAEQRIQKIAC